MGRQLIFTLLQGCIFIMWTAMLGRHRPLKCLFCNSVQWPSELTMISLYVMSLYVLTWLHNTRTRWVYRYIALTRLTFKAHSLVLSVNTTASANLLSPGCPAVSCWCFFIFFLLIQLLSQNSPLVGGICTDHTSMSHVFQQVAHASRNTVLFFASKNSVGTLSRCELLQTYR